MINFMIIKAKRLEPKWIVITAFFLSGIFLGALAIYIWLNMDGSRLLKIHQPSDYKYINPLLAVDVSDNKRFGKNKTIEIELKNFLEESKNKNYVSDSSVYYRDLENGSWLSINDDLKFSPGKLLKIPIMIAYYKIAESNPDILNNEIIYNGEKGKSENFFVSTTEPLKKGKYTVDELIKKMISQYDDNAAELLYDNIDKETLNEVFSDLGINFKEDKISNDFISLKSYGMFYRVLYNSTYLSREYSEKSLELIDKADDKIGLAANLPKSVLVASRVGGRTINSPKSYEIYDCGIVYYPIHPYILCAIAKGDNIDNLKNFIKKIGEVVYSETEYQYNK